jgi:microcompartment protein CcmK/EutM
MELATVIGACTATVKDAGLGGRKLALVRRIDEHGEAIAPVEVALDSAGAGLHSTVLLVRGSAARQPTQNRQLPVDLTVVAVIDEVHVIPAPVPAGPRARSTTRSRR